MGNWCFEVVAPSKRCGVVYKKELQSAPITGTGRSGGGGTRLDGLRGGQDLSGVDKRGADAAGRGRSGW